MFKKLLICSLPLILAACSTTQANWQQSESKEAVLVKTNNHAQLVDLYKKQLQQHDSNEVREKLAQSYLGLGDVESALLTIEVVTKQAEPTINSLLIQGEIFAEMGQYSTAIANAKRVLEMEPNNAEAENRLGSYYGYNYQYQLAREYFERSRQHFYDHVTINNNLAVVDIAQGKYKLAIKRLLPLYKNGLADQTVVANLILSMAKEGHYQFVEQMLEEKYSKHQIEQIYQSLQKYDPLNAANRFVQQGQGDDSKHHES